MIWDLDGVLVDSARFHYEAFRQLMQEMGKDLGEAEFRRLFGLRNETILRELSGELSPSEMGALATRKEEIFRGRIAGRVRPLPGAKDLVSRLSAAGIPQAIASSTPRANIELILRSLGLARAFAAVVGEEDVWVGKPDPEGFLTAARQLGVPPEGCVVLEDAPEGLAAARAAGMRSIGVATTRRPEQLSEADLVVRTLEDPDLQAFLRDG